MLAIAVALIGWWFSTGVILMLNHLPRGTYRWSFLCASALMLASLASLSANSLDDTAAGAIVGFLLVLVIWGWLEMGYLMGIVTGPHSEPCPAAVSPVQRFFLAIATSLYHELAVLVLAALVISLSWDGPNQVATLSFLTLWLMRWSAKLNLFLGVRNYNGQWLPDHLHYLDSYTRRRRMNALFPISLTMGLLAAFHLFQGAAAAGASDFDMIANTLVATLISLAVLEHLFLMLPLGDAALWRWALPQSATDQSPDPCVKET